MRERSSVSHPSRNEIFDLVIFAYSTKTRPGNLPASYASKSTDATIACEMSAHEGERTRDLHLLPDKARSTEFSVVEETYERAYNASRTCVAVSIPLRRISDIEYNGITFAELRRCRSLILGRS